MIPCNVVQVYVIAEDTEGNSQANPVRLAFTTLPDTLPPNITSSSGPKAITPTTFDIVLQQNERGSFYFLVTENSDQMAPEVMTTCM